MADAAAPGTRAVVDIARERYRRSGSDTDLDALVDAIEALVRGHVRVPPPRLTADERRFLLEESGRIGAVVVGVGVGRLTATLAQIDAARTIAIGIIAVDVASAGVGIGAVGAALVARADPDLIRRFVVVFAASLVLFTLSGIACGVGFRTGRREREFQGLMIRDLYTTMVGLSEPEAMGEMATALDTAIGQNFEFLGRVRRFCAMGLLLLAGAVGLVILLSAVLFR